MQHYLNDKFDKITICPNKEFNKKLLNKYHTCHFLGWMERKKLAGKYKGLTAGVSSHNFEYLHPEKSKIYMPKYNAITGNSMLIYNKLKEWNLNKNIYYTPNGVDESEFYPDPIKHEKFRIGWSGQPSGQYFNRTDGIDMHGYHNVLLPLVEMLKDENDIEFDIIARTHKNAIPHEEMPKFYNNLDLFVHTGFGIGTPNPAFEAQACGIPVIGTAIGALPELIINEVNGYLVPRYHNEKEAKDVAIHIKNIIIGLKDIYKDRLKEMGVFARNIIEEKWTWRERALAWLPVFMNHYKRI